MEVTKATGYLLGIGQFVQAFGLFFLVTGEFLLGTDDLSLLIATTALVWSVGNLIVVRQLQNALFRDGTREWLNWVR